MHQVRSSNAYTSQMAEQRRQWSSGAELRKGIVAAKLAMKDDNYLHDTNNDDRGLAAKMACLLSVITRLR